MKSLSQPFVSVIIPVFNDRDRLKTCLTSLEKQSYPKNLYEVIVIDNGSDSQQNIAEVIAQFKGVLATYESCPGSYAARNKGIAIAKGEVIAFTDADCIPAEDWIEKGVKNLLATPNCGLVVGKIEIFFKNTNRLTLVEQYESIMAFQQKEHLEKYKYGSTANVFTFKSVLNRVGFFDANLKSNGDFEWGRRVAAAGYQQVYADEVCVAHPARYSFAQLYKRTVRLAGGIYDAQIQKCDSYIQRNKLFLRSVLEDFAAPILCFREIFFNNNLKGFSQKITIYLIESAVRYIRAMEKIRLKLGGVSIRG
ncbi:glycosyltransferase [Candidatus Gracilibacteria bacterium]|nr:glycosyltransferase [Candidatus Gracilibacteria bacterium]